MNATKAVNVHTIAVQVPKSALLAEGANGTDVASSRNVIGVWTTASRQKVLIRDRDGDPNEAGPFTQVSRLGNPLFNEVLVPIERKDYWNASEPKDDNQFAGGVANPELANLLPILYPNVFPNLAALNASKKPRADLLAILLTGIPSGLIDGFQNFTGPTQADLLRLNVAIPPKTNQPSNLGLLGGDLAGFPNGRRVFDDVFTIELRAIAGVTYPLVDKTFTARRCCVGRHRRSHHQRVRPDRAGHREVPEQLPVPRHPAQRLRHPRAARREHVTTRPFAPERPLEGTLTCKPTAHGHSHEHDRPHHASPRAPTEW